MASTTYKYALVIAALLLPLMFSLDSQANPKPSTAGGFVGSKTCQQCHDSEYQQWQQSDHAKSMQPATVETVLGDFSDISLNFHGVNSHLYREGDRFLIDTQGAEGQQATYQILYTFGLYPLQQYLVEMANGHIQALNIAWDSRSIEQQGQRWFHLRADEEITPQDLFYWTRHFQNWNSRCSDCHSTNVDRNYDAQSHSYNTVFSEINVACEACHGPASNHLEWANGDQSTLEHQGFVRSAQSPIRWQFPEGGAIARPQGQRNDDSLNMCGDCHSLRTQLVAKAQGHNFHDSSQLRLVNEGPYFSDGQIQQETFVTGSFLQSKMYQQGVTCANCHNPHSGKLLIEGNGLCSQCHKPDVFDSEAHHRHTKDSTGAACVNCHMPERTYMQVDDRRDHSFTIPRPDLSTSLGVPNACTSCHDDDKEQNADWAVRQLALWGIKNDGPHWATLNRRALMADPMITRDVANITNAQELPELIRASLLQQLSPFPSRVSIETAQINLQDNSPLIRRAAAASLRYASPQIRWQILAPHIKDPSRSVRFQIAECLADLATQLPAYQQGKLSKLLDEYRESLLVSEDSPASQLGLAELAIRTGNPENAKQHYLHALRIEPNYVPALLNLADYYRQMNQPDQSAALLEQAIQVAPNSGAAHYSYGLMLIRNKQYSNSLKHLKLATEQADASPGYSYAYSVALEHQGELQAAIQILVEATEKWANQYDLLIALILYAEQADNRPLIYKSLSNVTVIAPNAPKVKELLRKYRPDFYPQGQGTTQPPHQPATNTEIDK